MVGGKKTEECLSGVCVCVRVCMQLKGKRQAGTIQISGKMEWIHYKGLYRKMTENLHNFVKALLLNKRGNEAEGNKERAKSKISQPLKDICKQKSYYIFYQ